MFEKVLTDVLDDRGLLKLTDVVSLPTGYGKSLIFQLAIPVIKHLQSQGTATDQNNFARQIPKNPLLIVIARLQATKFPCVKNWGLKLLSSMTSLMT